MEGASARPVFWAEELMDIGFEKFFTSPVMIMELGRIFGMVSFETVMYGLVVYATRMLLVNVCGIMTVVVEESVKTKEPLPLLVRMLLMYFSTIMLGIGLAIIIATALGGLIYWGRHVRKSASLLFKRYVAGSKEVKDVSFKILQRVIEVGNSRHDHVGNVDKAIAIRITVTRTAVCLLLGNLSVIQAESILRDIVDRCAGPDAISTINLAREALMYRKPGVDLGG